jgi:hypothetical protein
MMSRGKGVKLVNSASRERNVSVYLKNDHSGRVRIPAFGLIGIHMVMIRIRLQTWMRVIVEADVSR